jgi:FKBP-type peptidyl-prolyl cis-trans isomerase
MAAKQGDMVTVEYEGNLEDGTMFDTSVEKGKKPLQFMIGVGKFLKGFEEGIIGMEAGEVKKVVIPSDLGYQTGELAGKKLIFLVKLIKIGF